MKKILMLCAISAVLFGCTTPTTYKPIGKITGDGYEEIELSPNYFKVIFRGNVETSLERTADLALLRASDLMLARNCPSFEVAKSDQDVTTRLWSRPETLTTTTDTQTIGDTIKTTTKTDSTGGDLYEVHFPKVTLEVKCSTAKPDLEKNIYDTAFINRSLKQKYEVKN